MCEDERNSDFAYSDSHCENILEILCNVKGLIEISDWIYETPYEVFVDVYDLCVSNTSLSAEMTRPDFECRFSGENFKFYFLCFFIPSLLFSSLKLPYLDVNKPFSNRREFLFENRMRQGGGSALLGVLLRLPFCFL